MKKYLNVLIVCLSLVMIFAFDQYSNTTVSLKVKVSDLRNDKGVVQFALYNKAGSIPDENYKQYYKMKKVEIHNKSATITFDNLTPGVYAVNILHDENENGKIDKGWVLPVEGIGFSNYESIGLTNRPNFSKASFELKKSTAISVKIVYM
jgi:uncharacterized protein (DUF2141 family)